MTARSNQPQRLYLVRHGQTALNAEGRLRGLSNPVLNETGVLEANRLADTLGRKDPSLILSSPLERAAHTARIIAERAGIVSSVDDRFNDRDYGPQTGQVKADVIARWGTLDDAPGVEPVARVLARARPALDAVLNDGPAGTVIIVTHDAVIRPLIATIDPSKSDLTVPTGSWSELIRTETLWSVVAVDQIPDA